MSATVTAKIQVVKEKRGTTKTGKSYVAYSVMADGQWYNAGFNKPAVSKDDTVSITFETSTFGKEIKSITKVADGNAKENPVGAVTMKPIYLNNSRAIIRQNSLGHAIALYQATEEVSSGITLREHADIIIHLASIFESYSSGDLDLEAAKKALEVAAKATLADIPDTNEE